MLTVMKANCTTNGSKVSDWSRKPVFDLAANIDQSLRGMIDGEESRKLSHSRFARSGFLFVILFELGAVIGLRFPSTVPTSQVLAFEIFNILAGAFCLYVTWTVWFHYHWRLLVFAFCALVIASATYLSLHSGRTEPLFMSVIVLLIAGGSLTPWNARWQGALTFLCLSWLGVNAIWSPPSDIGLCQWLGLLAAGALAYSGAQMGAHCRAELVKEIESLQASLVKLRFELVNRNPPNGQPQVALAAGSQVVIQLHRHGGKHRTPHVASKGGGICSFEPRSSSSACTIDNP
jgi:hypothetical protein